MARDLLGRFARKPRDELSPNYRSRIERAAKKGKALNEARGHAANPLPAYRTGEFYGDPRYEKTLKVVRRMERGESRTGALKAEGIGRETFMRLGGSAVTRNEHGRWVAKRVNHLYRLMAFLDERGETYVEPANSREASKLARYHNAVDAYLTKGHTAELRRFAHQRLRTRNKQSLPFITDPRELDRLGQLGLVQFTSIYREVA